MGMIDRQFLEAPFYGARQMTWHLRAEGHRVNIKRVRRLMRLMGLMPIYRRPRTSIPAKGHKVYPYLLRGVRIERPNQVWCADITYIPMRRGFLYLVAGRCVCTRPEIQENYAQHCAQEPADARLRFLRCPAPSDSTFIAADFDGRERGRGR